MLSGISPAESKSNLKQNQKYQHLLDFSFIKQNKIMLEQKLLEWRQYQLQKRNVKLAKTKMMKIFPCACAVLDDNNVEASVPAYLKIINRANDKYIEIISKKRKVGLQPATLFKIPLNQLRGHQPDNNTILLTLREDGENREDDENREEAQIEQIGGQEIDLTPIRIFFNSADVMNAANNAIAEFVSEAVENVPTPPSFSESE